MAFPYNGVYLPPFQTPTTVPTTTPTGSGWLGILNTGLGILGSVLNRSNTQSTMYPTTQVPAQNVGSSGGMNNTMVILIAIVILTIINLRK